jgi:hypothetical protein
MLPQNLQYDLIHIQSLICTSVTEFLFHFEADHMTPLLVDVSRLYIDKNCEEYDKIDVSSLHSKPKEDPVKETQKPVKNSKRKRKGKCIIS